MSSTHDARDGLAPGDVVAGRYEVVRPLGAGGMGAVYEAVHIAIGRRVAIKVLRAEVATRADVMARFLREARAATDVRHRNIVEVLDFGVDAGQAFLVMEFLRGESLRALIEREAPLATTRAAALLLPVCRALAYAHGRGVIHRDVKPDNIFVAIEDGTFSTLPKLLDFGIATSPEEDAIRLTATGAALGTPLYMAPEQAGGARDVTAAADQYALGCVLFEALTGQPPLVADHYNAMIVAKVSRDAPRLETLREGVDPAVCDAVARMLARAPSARFPSLAEVCAVLEVAQAGGARDAGGDAQVSGLASTDVAAVQPVSRVAPLADTAAPSASPGALHAATGERAVVSAVPSRPRARTARRYALLGLGVVGLVATGALAVTLRGGSTPRHAALPSRADAPSADGSARIERAPEPAPASVVAPAPPSALAPPAIPGRAPEGGLETGTPARPAAVLPAALAAQPPSAHAPHTAEHRSAVHGPRGPTAPAHLQPHDDLGVEDPPHAPLR